ncbi:signal recognition particle-docking protein FtsY [Pseudoponticoccus marisrubri]|uniref:Signal recognition particle receptor FtsY n=1 Tax=Pseudoponticoccus marisrubri TaxID=1685382 RepID=A0A0W7WNB5_9RHOB|nr:signal recognition particle-docking protein FtsY [Pseudoponticoccus marisrubri]KUF12075.1 signal recognition particle-docking protein FtsY [Pseudoponticoccus marisrubri]
MSFFGKLKNRLFKSSSKLDEGLDAIVQDGGTEEPGEAPVEPAADARPDRAAQPEPAPAAKPESAPAPETEPEPAPKAEPDPKAEPEPAQKAEPEPETDPAPEPDPAPEGPKPLDMPAMEEAPAAPAARGGLFGRLLGRGGGQAVMRRELDDDMLESLEELLIASDMGVDTALRVTANIAEGRFGKRLSVDEIKALLAQEIARIMEPVARPLPLYPKKPQVVLVVGVNGSGKTTTIGKLASQFRAAGKSVVIAAGDTFRAAAVEQLQVWGDRAGVPVLTAAQGSDPASLAFDALAKAQADGADLLMIDTAGRLQNRADLMEELAKIVRVIRKKDPDAPHNTLLVLDATTGQNALNQVETFRKLADVSGLVMTKLDGTAKGGVLVALADKFGLPIHAIGVGEQIDDLAPFDPEDFAAALTGLDKG